MATLLLAEHDDKSLNEATARALTAAAALGAPVDILVAGQGCRAVAEAAAKLHGVNKVLLADDDSLAHRRAEPVAGLLVSLADGYDSIVAPATSFGKNVLPRLAALLDVMQVSDITRVVSADTFERPIYAGNAIETVRSLDPKKIITVRISAFPAVEAEGSAPIETVGAPGDAHLSSFVGADLSVSERPELASARVIVSGGRALGSAAKFEEVLVPLADRLKAAIGASRAAVDAGYAGNDLQVGQTGKVVAPDLYVAVGISGAIQHLAGMKDSKVIVAINKDGDAPIFQVADFGLVDDLFTAVPALVEALGNG
ncbi:electron transfer flavoprotein subunit alpha [Kaistia algarum]|uniref:electron transfer flavoprotein subunit alpha/FixB family protein n=1 Tax=Kaistia algarum TaxID=2083279 RepID=UPI000CE8F25C|nr:FAD-binding protein [Kaistia algarum]MCX5514292.1 FAD-binding protein [Kaistia algarum]PPE79047.1 electron transfer flavoprotein subunit alpha [Kaistia algarum]